MFSCHLFRFVMSELLEEEGQQEDPMEEDKQEEGEEGDKEEEEEGSPEVKKEGEKSKKKVTPKRGAQTGHPQKRHFNF